MVLERRNWLTGFESVYHVSSNGKERKKTNERALKMEGSSDGSPKRRTAAVL
jgi:hypothetical protein